MRHNVPLQAIMGYSVAMSLLLRVDSGVVVILNEYRRCSGSFRALVSWIIDLYYLECRETLTGYLRLPIPLRFISNTTSTHKPNDMQRKGKEVVNGSS